MPPLMRGKCGVPSSELSDAEVAAPERALHRQAVEAGVGAKADRLELAAHRLEEAVLGDVVDAAFGLGPAEVVAGERPGPGDAAAGVRQQAELQRGQVALADPARAALDAASRSASSRSGRAAASGRSRRGWPARRSAARAATRWIAASRVVVVAGEALRAWRRRPASISTAKPSAPETRGGAAQRRDRAQHAGRREQLQRRAGARS